MDTNYPFRESFVCSSIPAGTSGSLLVAALGSAISQVNAPEAVIQGRGGPKR